MKLNDLTIKVRRFGPLENVSFKLAPMMIFTGKSSLGKSYANYLVYYFFHMVCNGKLKDFVNSAVGKGENTKTNKFYLDEFLEDLGSHAEEFMRKFLGDDELTCEVAFKSLKRNRTLSFEIKKIEVNPEGGNNDNSMTLPHHPQPYLLIINGTSQTELPSLEYVKFLLERHIQIFILGDYIARAIILPPGRGAFAGENFSMKTEVASSLTMYNNYFRDYDYGLTTHFHMHRESSNDMSDSLLRLTSGGHLINIDGKQYLQLSDTEKIALSAGASSIKDLAPWLFYLKNHWMLPFSFCLEEPEAHQHPSVTVQIADVMAMAMHLRTSNVFHLTTHSDYLLQRINQLIRLGGIRQKDKKVFLSICKERNLDKNCFLDAKEIQAYYFSKNEKGKTVVESLGVTDDGIPMKSFFDVVSDLEDREEYINAAVYRLNKD